MKVARHEKIKELIQQYDIDTQEELASRLNEAGFKVTQATVSRDIRALKMMKVTGKDGKSRYVILQELPTEMGEKYTRVLHDALLTIDQGQNILVIRTVPGMAMGVAAALGCPELGGNSWKYCRRRYGHARGQNTGRGFQCGRTFKKYIAEIGRRENVNSSACKKSCSDRGH